MFLVKIQEDLLCDHINNKDTAKLKEFVTLTGTFFHQPLRILEQRALP